MEKREQGCLEGTVCAACGKLVSADGACALIVPVYGQEEQPGWCTGEPVLIAHAACMAPQFKRRLIGRVYEEGALGCVYHVVEAGEDLKLRADRSIIGTSKWLGMNPAPWEVAKKRQAVKVGIFAALIAAALLGAWWYSQRPAAEPAEKVEVKKAAPVEKKRAVKRAAAAAPAPVAPATPAEVASASPNPREVVYGGVNVYDPSLWGGGTSAVDTRKTHAGGVRAVYLRGDEAPDFRAWNIFGGMKMRAWLPPSEAGLLGGAELSVVIPNRDAARSESRFAFVRCAPGSDCSYEAQVAVDEPGNHDVVLRRSAKTGNLFIAIALTAHPGASPQR